jgi:hypothetical protein
MMDGFAPKPRRISTLIALDLLSLGLAVAVVATLAIAFDQFSFLPACAAQGPWHPPHGMVKAGSGPVAQDGASLSLLNPHKGMLI